MDDEQRKKVKHRTDAIKELVQREKLLYDNVNDLVNTYSSPMKEKFRQQHDLIFKGVDAVQMYTTLSYEFLHMHSGSNNNTVTPPILAGETEENYQKADIIRYLRDFINKYIMCFKVFMKGTYETTEYLFKLNDKTPLKKWLEEQQFKSERHIPLDDYLDRIRKHPGQVQVVIEKIIRNTLDSDPQLPQLITELANFKKKLVELDLVVATESTRAIKDLQALQTLIGPSIKILLQTRHLITKGQFYCVFPGDQVELLQFYLCNDLLLYGKEQDKHFIIRDRFYLVDSTVELEEGLNIITIQDNEKCLTFYSVDGSVTASNEMGIEDWYNEIVQGIASMQKKQRLCGICNESCKLSSSLQKELDERGSVSVVQAVEDSKEPLKAVVCRGCGRSICERCAVETKASVLQDADDMIAYCLHCRNWNKREWDMGAAGYQTNSENYQGDWKKAVHRERRTEYWYNDQTNEAAWVPLAEERKETGPNNRWISYTTVDGRPYYYDMNTHQVQWKQTIDPIQQGRICFKCGAEMKTWNVVCNRCSERWRH